MFGSAHCKDLFDAAPAKYLEPALAPLAAMAAESAVARATLDKAAAAMGALDTVTTFEERASQSRPPQGGALIFRTDRSVIAIGRKTS